MPFTVECNKEVVCQGLSVVIHGIHGVLFSASKPYTAGLTKFDRLSFCKEMKTMEEYSHNNLIRLTFATSYPIEGQFY